MAMHMRIYAYEDRVFEVTRTSEVSATVNIRCEAQAHEDFIIGLVEDEAAQWVVGRQETGQPGYVQSLFENAVTWAAYLLMKECLDAGQIDDFFAGEYAREHQGRGLGQGRQTDGMTVRKKVHQYKGEQFGVTQKSSFSVDVTILCSAVHDHDPFIIGLGASHVDLWEEIWGSWDEEDDSGESPEDGVTEWVVGRRSRGYRHKGRLLGMVRHAADLLVEECKGISQWTTSLRTATRTTPTIMGA